MTTQLKARLDRKTSRRVLCGRPTCHGEIGELKGTTSRGPLILKPGYHKRKDGVWDLSRRAQRRLKKPGGSRALNRRSFYSPIRTATEDGQPIDPPPMGWVLYSPTPLPAEAICPDCGWRNILDPETLRLT